MFDKLKVAQYSGDFKNFSDGKFKILQNFNSPARKKENL